MDLDERTRRLLRSGVELLAPWPLSDAGVMPPEVAWSAIRCPRDGRPERVFSHDDPARVAEGNAAWLAFATEFGLFDDGGTFLLSVETGTHAQWFRTRLTGDWDLFGLGAQERVLGWGWGVPAFVTQSLDGTVLIGADWFEDTCGVFVVPDLADVAASPQFFEAMLREPYPADSGRDFARRWLKGDAGTGLPHHHDDRSVSGG